MVAARGGRQTARPAPGSRLFEIEDEWHAEVWGEYPSLAEAVAELERRASAPWDEPPNRAPCTSWRTCGRHYEVVELDVSGGHPRVVGRGPRLEVDAGGARWLR